eukprot:TRINITY_DN34611_c0_g1_i1.p1 TRINITY_DN34611_c0_g1~~TRINITY_DN34611_c0_g1_i1.p1  ORF type:complete len:179 (-),score=21.88 TRINITY_DN34611_c0_g1_i1:184-720(-)
MGSGHAKKAVPSAPSDRPGDSQGPGVPSNIEDNALMSAQTSSSQSTQSVVGAFGDGPGDTQGIGVWSNIEFLADNTFKRFHEDYFRTKSYAEEERSGGVSVQATGAYSIVAAQGDVLAVECQVQSTFYRAYDEAMLTDIGRDLAAEFKEGAVFHGKLQADGFLTNAGRLLPVRQGGGT